MAIMYSVAIILYLFSGSAFARIASNSGHNAFPTNNFLDNKDSYEDNDDYDNDYEYGLKSEQCELSEKPPSPDSMCCGVDMCTNDRIVGGSPTLINQYPWLAIIEYEVRGLKRLYPQCAGSLISGLYVLTAAHCVTGSILERSTPRNVVLGDYDKYHSGKDCIKGPADSRTCSEGEVRIGIEKYIAHESYNSKLQHDIALIMLKTMAPYTQSIRPICLPAGNLALTRQRNLWLTIAGWGIMKQVQIKGSSNYTATSSDVKRHLRLPYVLPSKCRKTWAQVNENQVCAGGLAGQDACMGDSGGPLMLQRDGQYELVGTVSYGAGKPCGKVSVPGVYSNVFRYKGWIMDNINFDTLMEKNKRGRF